MIKAFLCIAKENSSLVKNSNNKPVNKPPMKKRFLRLFFLAGMLLTMLTACEYSFIEPTPAPPPPPEGDTISYSQEIQPVFNASCNTCHASVPPVLTAATSYNNLMTGGYVVAKDPINSVLYNVCKPGGSMSSYTSEEELDLIYRWIYAGAKND
jgi:hypothetical protein